LTAVGRWAALTRPALIVLVVLALLVALVWFAQRRLIYFPDRSAVPAAGTVLPGGRDVVLETSDGLRLGAWLVPPTAGDRRVAVLCTPGNAGNRSGRAPFAAALARAGLTVLLVDYRGYGGNPGDPTEQGLARDARAAHAYLRAHLPGIGALIYVGESLGAAVATELATAHPPAGLVLRSPFTDLAAVGRQHYPFLPVGVLLRDRFPVADLIGRVTVPTVVVYGTADSVVPPAQSRAVAARAGGPVRLVAVDGADHNDEALSTGSAFVAAVVRLADEITR